ncbi:hypothetical protein PSHT_10232 [Puccinia striiformis]|uniref:Uncharacterized protein n=1 Tax=Puccinia striiformis TaxID=27350 RepID=A0A2S4VB70_9BASI|nr:hypothetical protein PSHT_10232 [Puccinia striiformis]
MTWALAAKFKEECRMTTVPTPMTAISPHMSGDVIKKGYNSSLFKSDIIQWTQADSLAPCAATIGSSMSGKNPITHGTCSPTPKKRLRSMLYRRMAALCHPNQPGIDQIFTINLKRDLAKNKKTRAKEEN